MSIKILQPKSFTPGTISELNCLLYELHPRVNPPTFREWRAFFSQKDARLFVAREDVIVGIAILRWHDLPSGRVGSVEDVVISSKNRGMGYGSQLMAAIIGFAKKQKITHIDLTSRPSRRAANKLYQKFGWEKRRTNVYRLLL